MPRRQVFDVVVVGAGAAGCVVAARLAALSSRTVLLVEAGPDRRAATPERLRDGWRIAREDFDWGYHSVPDERGVAANVWRTKLLGGTSWLTRFTLRGSPADYDEWAARGNPGWSFDEVLPYFNRLECDTDFGREPWHGDRGPMPSNRYLDLEPSATLAAGVAALESVGFPTVADHNRPGSVGVGRMPMNSRDGVRVTAADAYLPADATPPNITVLPDTTVARILFDDVRARGVELIDGTEIEAGWVVISAGTYGSPALLIRSGIGPPSLLSEIAVPVLVDLLGVGENLIDHPGVYVECGYTGPGRDAPLLHTVATFHSTATSATAAPDLMLWMSDPEGAGGEAVFDIDIVMLRPRSRGRVRVGSSDPREPPLIELPTLVDDDVDRLCEGYARALDVANRRELRGACDGPPLRDASIDELRERVRSESYSLPHVVGTCAMGPADADGAVVDAEGRVHGTEHLSVIDASVMPDVPSGFTHFPTIMIAERLAEQLAAAL